MIKIKMSNGDEFKVDDTRRSFVEYELHYTVTNFGQSTKVQCRGLRTINTVNGEITINVDQVSSIEDIEE
ncbi:hypothetical protein ACV3X1_00545 [Clostridium perfringens]|uniref:hypothetical protein n=1 Tax=Clostridium perfringens TaxID=1502 RepID=UPI0013E2B65F|nr:hypothetical protein [Clostridium perfringens]MCR1963959.1 hypothetical protein [Clostridium perfringens]MDM0720346.1 hypothetical protein [Clostridium perfringens]MDM0723412.1 hypothetical protein [Clostridium perfringens]QPR51379.1 hypothetical protein I6G88_15015 [Clostridium perfringens]QPS27024.1 hypothetical protein I6G61_11360 [Clostridium perfringens]